MKQFFYLLLFITIALQSCTLSRAVYSSPVPNNPILEDAKDASVGVHLSGKPFPNIDKKRWGTDVHLAYAPINHLACTYSYSHRQERDIFHNSYNNYFDSSTVKYNHNNHEFAVGFFYTPNRSGIDNHRARDFSLSPLLWGLSIFDNTRVGINIFGGFGFGSNEFIDNGIINPDTTFSRYFNGSYTKFFLQPSINFFKSQYFSFSFTGKFSHIRFNSISSNYNIKELSYFNMNELANKTLHVNELFTQINYKIPDIEWLQFQLNLGTAWVDNDRSYARSVTGSVAVYCNPFIMFQKKK